ncbi:hypothetical protein AFK24_02965 [Pseudomonas syringae]|uniref:Uncharacterized protein n=1 Tax=Pseudomonas syringae TaxID=317 RepID=A0A1C7ZD76_PSESX|nr:hypothetical protein AFK24_02965 [Pseudomonas syringae]
MAEYLAAGAVRRDDAHLTAFVRLDKHPVQSSYPLLSFMTGRRDIKAVVGLEAGPDQEGMLHFEATTRS